MDAEYRLYGGGRDFGFWVNVPYSDADLTHLYEKCRLVGCFTPPTEEFKILSERLHKEAAVFFGSTQGLELTRVWLELRTFTSV
jgi:hypothetical protein